MGETFKPLVCALEPGLQSSAANKAAGAVVLGDEAAKYPVAILHRLDQAEYLATPAVDRNVLETQTETGGRQQHIAPTAPKGEVDASDLIEVVEYHKGGRLVEQRDATRFQSALFRPSREQAEQLFLADQFEFLSHSSKVGRVAAQQQDGITVDLLCPRPCR